MTNAKHIISNKRRNVERKSTNFVFSVHTYVSMFARKIIAADWNEISRHHELIAEYINIYAVFIAPRCYAIEIDILIIISNAFTYPPSDVYGDNNLYGTLTLSITLNIDRDTYFTAVHIKRVECTLLLEFRTFYYD